MIGTDSPVSTASFTRQDPRMSNPWPLRPVPILVGYWMASFAIVGGLSIAFSKWLDPKRTWYAFCVLWMALAVASSIQVNGVSYLFVVPILATTVFACVACWFGEKGLIASIVVTSIAVGLIWFPMEPLLYDAVGFRMPIATLLCMSMLGTTLLGLLSISTIRTRFSFAIITVVVSVAAFGAAIILNSEV